MAVMLSGTVEIFYLTSSCHLCHLSPCLSPLNFALVTTVCSVSRFVFRLLLMILVVGVRFEISEDQHGCHCHYVVLPQSLQLSVVVFSCEQQALKLFP
jgi:hypothetical protein